MVGYVEVGLPTGKPVNRLIGGYFDMPVSQQLRIVAAERNTTLQELLRETLNDLYQKYKSRIA